MRLEALSIAVSDMALGLCWEYIRLELLHDMSILFIIQIYSSSIPHLIIKIPDTDTYT
jgi:hypothetical protein